MQGCAVMRCLTELCLLEKCFETDAVHVSEDWVIAQNRGQHLVHTVRRLQQVRGINNFSRMQTLDQRVFDRSFKSTGEAFNSESASTLCRRRLQSINVVPPPPPAIHRPGTPCTTRLFLIFFSIP